jgi:DNA-binding SARP family transcriptional activator
LNGIPLIGLQTREGERLLALLVIHARRTVLSTTLAATLWPETESLDSLRQSVIHLRQVLGEEAPRLQTPKGGLFLELNGTDVDVIAFDAAVERGDLASLKAAVSLYRGPLLHGWEENRVEDTRWVQKARERRRARYLEALKALGQASLAQQDYTAAADYLRRYVTLHPAEEWAWGTLMQALVESGERLAALSYYTKGLDYFQKFKLTPPEEMTRLYQQVLSNLPRQPPGLPEDQAQLEPVGGAVPLQSPFYVVRPADAAFQTAVRRRDSIVLVKGPRQTGKTSLLARSLQQAREEGAVVVMSDLQKLSPEHLGSAQAFYQALARSLAEQLELTMQLQETWREADGTNENFERYVRREVLQKVASPLVWGLDEVDRLFDLPFSGSVFALFRAWHNERSLAPSGPWGRLTLAISYATEAHLFISDLNQSPFNVGTRITLEDFTPGQVADLNGRYGSPLKDAEEERRYFRLVGGHPYLVRRGLHEMVTRPLDLAAFAMQADHDEGCYGDHLRRMLLALSQDEELCAVVRGMLQGQSCASLQSFYRLRSAGVLVGDSPRNAQFRCHVYQTYLEAHLL